MSCRYWKGLAPKLSPGNSVKLLLKSYSSWKCSWICFYLIWKNDENVLECPGLSWNLNLKFCVHHVMISPLQVCAWVRNILTSKSFYRRMSYDLFVLIFIGGGPIFWRKKLVLSTIKLRKSISETNRWTSKEKNCFFCYFRPLLLLSREAATRGVP